MLGCFQLTARKRFICLLSNSFGPFGGFPWEGDLGRFWASSWGLFWGLSGGGPENAWMSSINGPDKVFLFVLKQFWAIWGVSLGKGFGTIVFDFTVSGEPGSTYQGRRHAAEA